MELACFGFAGGARRGVCHRTSGFADRREGHLASSARCLDICPEAHPGSVLIHSND